MSIIIDILTILGIIIGVILGVVVILLLLVLFVPVRYRISGRVDENKYAKIRVSWLLSIVTFHCDYEDELDKSLRVFGIVINRFDKKKEEEISEEVASECIGGSEEKEASACQEKKSRVIMNKINQFKIKLSVILDKIKELYEKPKNIYILVEDYKSIWERNQTKVAIDLCIEQLGYLLNKLKPTKLKCRIEYGAGNPAATGEMLGYRSMLFPIIGKRVVFIPNFDEQVLKAVLDTKGRLYLIFVLIIAIKLFASKELKRTLKLEKRARMKFKKNMKINSA